MWPLHKPSLLKTLLVGTCVILNILFSNLVGKRKGKIKPNIL